MPSEPPARRILTPRTRRPPNRYSPSPIGKGDKFALSTEPLNPDCLEMRTTQQTQTSQRRSETSRVSRKARKRREVCHQPRCPGRAPAAAPERDHHAAPSRPIATAPNPLAARTPRAPTTPAASFHTKGLRRGPA
ncbi:hypothetical protein L596_017226 [Steinernema carpocapsae]|uniref:Uncharacterized protein n=1 Tax=Steinernema carpocapsae TaxID=34508 RepID=A0A4U5N0Z9_STECR|nr:hypothetical protein L596_017226 [Steinernema carpocapsae]